MKYTGGCHCGAVRFEAEMNLEKTIKCNCSHCYIKGLVLAFVPSEKVTLLTPDAALSEYQFNKYHIHHMFCPVCGVEVFGHGKGPDGNEMHGINVRCLKDVDVNTLDSAPYNGKEY
jgi:hypothetical protein